MKYSKILLTEGISDIVYHYTYVDHLLSILRTNRFATSSNLGSVADSWKDKGRFFFFSTQRTKGLSGYGRNHGTVCIVLDGRKLNQRYKGHPTDYWNWSTDPKEYKDKQTYRQALLSKENEDRIVTDEPFIENAKSYILEVHILAIRESDHTAMVDNEEISAISSYSDGDFPIYYYITEQDYKLQNKAKSVLPKDLGIVDDPNKWRSSERSMVYTFKKLAPYIIASSEQNKEPIEFILKRHLKSIGKEEMFDNIMKEIDEKAKNISYYRNQGYGNPFGDDAYNGMSADIHNNRGNPDTLYRDLLKIMVKDMRRIGAKNLKDYMHNKKQ
jgi:hypothetical protein